MSKERARNALKATRALGIPDDEVKPVLKDLLKLFDKSWEVIEAEDYRVLIDAYFEFKENKVIEGEERSPIEDDFSERPSKRLHFKEQEDQSSSTLDTPGQIIAVKEEGGTSMTLDLKSRVSSKLCSESRRVRRIESSSLFPNSKLAEKKKDPIPSEIGPRDRKSTSKEGSCSKYSKHRISECVPSCLQINSIPSNDHDKDHINQRIKQTRNNLTDFAEPGAALNPGELIGLKLIDITKGAEKVKIPLVDETGDEDLPKFTYMPDNIIYQNAYLQISLARIADMDCCSNCLGDCLSSPIPCECARETGGEFAYMQHGLLKQEFLSACVSIKRAPQKHNYVFCQDCPLERSKNEYMPEQCKGHLVKKFIKECWRKCGCDMNCGNRVVQRGITCGLQVFLTCEGKGWGLRTIEDLPKGTFVCEYVGEILTNMELYERNMQSSGSDRHTYPVTLDADWGSERVLRDEEALCLDATFSGNVGRFINHRCDDANLIDIPVEVETPDRHYYHLAFFTTREVRAFEELTWDYGIDFDDHDHPVKAFQCCCGSASCRDVKGKRNSITRIK